MITREPIYAALAELVFAVPGLVTTSRTLLHWDKVNANQMPALFQAQTAQTPNADRYLPPRWMLGAMFYLYVSTNDERSPGEVANPIVDAITALFDVHPVKGAQTLGGLVEWARIGGTIETSEGTLGRKEVLQIPVSMLTV